MSEEVKLRECPFERASDQRIIEWAEAYGIQGSTYELRSAYEDAQTWNHRAEPQVQGWRDISTRPENVAILAFSGVWGNVQKVMFHNGAWHRDGHKRGDEIRDKFTHWMPLPSPPKQESGT